MARRQLTTTGLSLLFLLLAKLTSFFSSRGFIQPTVFIPLNLTVYVVCSVRHMLRMCVLWCAACIACYGCGTECVSHVTGEDNMWLEILFNDLFSQTSQALREEVGSEYIQMFWNTSITYVPTALSSKTDIMKETEQDLSLVFQNCPSPTQTNFTNSSGRL